MKILLIVAYNFVSWTLGAVRGPMHARRFLADCSQISWQKYHASMEVYALFFGIFDTVEKSLLKIAPIRRAYNVVADNTGLSKFV